MGSEGQAEGRPLRAALFRSKRPHSPKCSEKPDIARRASANGTWGPNRFRCRQHHGFDVNIAGNAHGAPGNYFFPYNGDWKIPTTGLRAQWNVLPDGRPGEYLTDRLTDEAVRFMTESRDKPFFLYFPHYGVHYAAASQGRDGRPL